MEIFRAPVQTIDRPALAPIPNPRPLELDEVEWQVITREGDPVVFAVSPREYEILAGNLTEINRWVLEAMWRLQYYRGNLPDTE